ncbi:MAG: hypothetical protein ABFS86_04450 [Planctomycetota bacterium]
MFRFPFPIAVVGASLVAALAVTVAPVPEPEAPSVAPVVPGIARPVERPAAGASHGGSAPEASPEPAPGDPWPAARLEERRYRRRHHPKPRVARRPPRPEPRLLAEAALRIASGEWGTRPDVWDDWMEHQTSWTGLPDALDFRDIFSRAAGSPFAASFEEYAAIRGGGYFSGPRSTARGDARYDPDREIPGFTAWVEKYPAHPGADDACYRLGRCWGIRGDGRRALHWFRRAQDAPDGDMEDDARAWELLWLDMLLPMGELRAEAASGDIDALWSLGVRLVRRGEIDEGLRWMRAAYPALTGRTAERARVHLAKVERLKRTVRKGDLYEIGRSQYHTRGLYENVLWRWGRSGMLNHEGVLWSWGHAGAPEAFVEEYRLANRHWQARRTFLEVVDGHPGGELEAKARYSATTALGHTQGWYLEQRMVSCPEEDRVRLAREFLAIARDFPASTLADDALLFSGRFSGDPEAFAEILRRYPDGDMTDRAEFELERALEFRPATVDQLAKRVDLVANGRAGSWRVWEALGGLERRLGFCTVCLDRLRGAERKRRVGEFVAWFRSVRGKLVFDRTAGMYVVRGAR